jgi:hypothetical protein
LSEHDKWIKAFVALTDSGGEAKLSCPSCGRVGTIDFQFVGDPVSRKGYLQMWCRECKKGLSLSRLLIPHWASLVDWNSEKSLLAERIPSDITEVEE